MRGKRVGVIGTGASGVQVIQEAGPLASHLTVFQRTPNLALPMRQSKLDAQTARRLKDDYPARFKKRGEAFAGFDMDFLPKNAMDVSAAERRSFYEDLWARGGFSFWLSTFQDVLGNEDANRTAYDFWREKTLARLERPEMAEKLAPAVPIHPFGVKRPSLEQRYYEVYNQHNVDLVDLRTDPILKVVPQGVVTASGLHELDVLVLATGFDAVTGGLTAIDIRSTQGQSLKDKWAAGARAHLGMLSADFPNMVYIYGPQSPSAFCNGPTCAELQGDWVVQFLSDLKKRNITRFEATREAEDNWRDYSLSLTGPLFLKAESWYIGANVPGKPREMLAYTGGLPTYLQKCRECAEKGYEGIHLE